MAVREKWEVTVHVGRDKAEIALQECVCTIELRYVAL